MKDKIVLQKIQKYIERIRPIYESIKDLDEEAILEKNDSYAMTQMLINIHSLFNNVDNEDIVRKQVDLGFRDLNSCRNISAHDYDSLDWSRVKRMTKKIVSDQTQKLLDECIEMADKSGQQLIKDLFE